MIKSDRLLLYVKSAFYKKKKMKIFKPVKKRFVVFLLPIMTILSGFSSFAHYSNINTFSVKTTVLENFFSTLNLPANALAKMLSSKNNSNTDSGNKKDSQKDNKFINDNFALPSFSNSFMSVKNIILFAGADIIAGLNNIAISMNIEYPLKIPLWRLIFFLLLLKLLQTVLPRSSSVDYNNYYKYREACALL